MRSNRPQYCMVCRLLLVSHFSGSKNGRLMCQTGLSEGPSVAVLESEICF